MTATAEKLCSDLLALSEEDRAELAQMLLDSLESEQSAAEERAFIKELDRRKADYLSGKTPGLPMEEALAQLDAHLALRRK